MLLRLLTWQCSPGWLYLTFSIKTYLIWAVLHLQNSSLCCSSTFQSPFSVLIFLWPLNLWFPLNKPFVMGILEIPALYVWFKSQNLCASKVPILISYLKLRFSRQLINKLLMGWQNIFILNGPSSLSSEILLTVTQLLMMVTGHRIEDYHECGTVLSSGLSESDYFQFACDLFFYSWHWWCNVIILCGRSAIWLVWNPVLLKENFWEWTHSIFIIDVLYIIEIIYTPNNANLQNWTGNAH